MNFYTINRGLSKRLHSYFSYQARKMQYETKIKNAIKYFNCRPLTKAQVEEIKDYYACFGFNNINTKWHQYFTHISGKFYKEYIPQDLFFNTVEPNLNMVNFSLALTDKNLLSKLTREIKQPKTIVKNINGIYFNENDQIIDFEEALHKCMSCSKFIIKPSIGSFGGNNITVFKKENNVYIKNKLLIEHLLKRYHKNFIVQLWLVQNKYMHLLNPTSVNTLRFTTLLIMGKVEILKKIVRIGGSGSQVDNTSQGGIFCNIKPNGKLDKNGYNKIGEFIYATDSGIRLDNYQIPNYKIIVDIVKKLHMQFPYFKIISWDIAIDEKGEAVLIEYNVRGQGIGVQYAYGPLFGKFTEEVLSNCKTDKFSNLNRY